MGSNIRAQPATVSHLRQRAWRLKHLSTANTWCMDSNLVVAPRGFCKLYIIYCPLGNTAVLHILHSAATQITRYLREPACGELSTCQSSEWVKKTMVPLFPISYLAIFPGNIFFCTPSKGMLHTRICLNFRLDSIWSFGGML